MARAGLTRPVALRIGLIGGTGFYDVGRSEALELETSAGSLVLHRTRMAGRETFFLPRHGRAHELPAHRIDHRAHMEALAAAHCDYVIGVNNVGSLDATLRPGAWVVVDDFLDLHRRAVPTRFDDRAVHVDFSTPYCPTATKALVHSARPPLRAVAYAGVDGPRFETPAEVRLLARAGAQVVGMTGVPEAVLARESGLCYASLAFVGNYATGLGPRLAAARIQKGLAARRRRLLFLLGSAIGKLPAKKTCPCSDALVQAELALGGHR